MATSAAAAATAAPIQSATSTASIGVAGTLRLDGEALGEEELLAEHLVRGAEHRPHIARRVGADAEAVAEHSDRVVVGVREGRGQHEQATQRGAIAEVQRPSNDPDHVESEGRSGLRADVASAAQGPTRSARA